MIFLNPIYQQIYALYSTRINHFPLIRLFFYSLDKTIFYFLIFCLLRFGYLRIRRSKINWSHELLLSGFVIYLLLLFFLTVFRHGYFPWEFRFYWHRPLTEINWHPFVQTLKLTLGKSILDFLYNLGGNIAWFIPWGIFFPLVKKHTPGLKKTVLSGMLVSLVIESLQFVLFTGVSDVDDVIFNTIGALLGYLLLRLFKIF